MKKFNCVYACIIITSILFVTCKKQITEPAVSVPGMPYGSMQATSCKATGFSFYEQGFFTRWVNIMQRWYDNDKVRNIKLEFADSRFGFNRYGSEPALYLRYGTVTYEDNQVYLRQEGNNYLVFRATVDESGKALATYYQNPGNSTETFAYDTLYYYYTGDRLDSVVQLSKARFLSTTVQSWEKYIFFYDGMGNLVSINGANKKTRLKFAYDYSRPVAGIIAHYRLTIPFRVAEFLDLVRLPMHFVVTEAITTAPNADGIYVGVAGEGFANHVINNGLVYAYHNPQNDAIFQRSYYTQWDCGSDPASKTLEQ